MLKSEEPDIIDGKDGKKRYFGGDRLVEMSSIWRK